MSLSPKKQLGVFYTTGQVTDLLCNWAIRSPEDTVLEPSFGGCGFLDASVRRLEELSCSNPTDHLFGCDLDPRAFEHLITSFGHINTADRFLHTDFLGVKPNDFRKSVVSVVIGNPPYVSHHNMAPQQKQTAFALAESHGLTNKKASLWAYFVRHSLSFLEIGGRFAWVLPGSLLQTEYGVELLNALRYHFRRSVAILLGERLFLEEGAEEKTVVLLCEDFRPGNTPNAQVMGFAADLETLATTIDHWVTGEWQGFDPNVRLNRVLLNGARTLFEDISTEDYCFQFGSFCDVRIGLVTGANKFFVLTRDQAKFAKLDSGVLTFILTRFSDACGLSLGSRDQHRIVEENRKCLLVDTSCVGEIEGSLKLFLEQFPEADKAKNRTFQKRQNGKYWHRPNDGSVPDAFFPYMQSNGPSLLLNKSGSTSTNSIHRVYFKPDVTRMDAMSLSVSMLSSFSQLSAEIEGRSYGSGVLKHEPSEVKRLQILLPPGRTTDSVERVFAQVESCLRSRDFQSAQRLADEFVLANFDGAHRALLASTLNCALVEARARRHRHQKNPDNYTHSSKG